MRLSQFDSPNCSPQCETFKTSSPLQNDKLYLTPVWWINTVSIFQSGQPPTFAFANAFLCLATPVSSHIHSPFYLSNRVAPSLCHFISCIISPTFIAFLPLTSVFRFIPARTLPPSHYLLPASINSKYIYTDRSQIQTHKCNLAWPRACGWWSQVELIWWSFPYCNAYMWLFH